MKKVINFISNLLNKIIVPIGCVTFAVLVVATIIQVCCRYFLKISVPWTEELARFCFIWSTMLGASVLVKFKGHPAVDAITGRLKGTAKSIHEVLVCLMMLAVCYICIRHGFQLVGKTMSQLSPVLQVPYGIVYLSLPLGAVAMVVHLLSEIIDIISGMVQAKKKEE